MKTNDGFRSRARRTLPALLAFVLLTGGCAAMRRPPAVTSAGATSGDRCAVFACER